MSPLQLNFAMRVLDHRERLERLKMARAMEAAFVAAQGGKVDWSKL